MTYIDPTTARGGIDIPRPPLKPARPPAHCDTAEFRRYRLADHAYRRELAAYLAVDSALTLR